MAKPVRTKNKDNARRAEEEGEPPAHRARRVRRLEGRQPAPPVHVRPGEDPRPSRHRQQHPAAGRDRRWRSRTPARWRCCPYASRVTPRRGGPRGDGERGGRRERDRDLRPPTSSRSAATRRSTLGTERARRRLRHRRARRGDGGRAGGRVVKLVLRSDVAQVGKKGDIVDVADGYGRNFLVPKGLAFLASPGVEAQADRDAPQRATSSDAERLGGRPGGRHDARAEGRHHHGSRRGRGQALRVGHHRRDRRGGRDADRRRSSIDASSTSTSRSRPSAPTWCRPSSTPRSSSRSPSRSSAPSGPRVRAWLRAPARSVVPRALATGCPQLRPQRERQHPQGFPRVVPLVAHRPPAGR